MPAMTPDGASRHYIEKLMLVTALGLVEALKKGSIEFAEANKLLFSPSSMKFVEEEGLGEELKRIIHMGTELEDVASIVPDALEEALSELSTAINLELQQSHPLQPAIQRWYRQITLSVD